ncbi:ArsA-related P-loop ATPase [Granulicoccus phenolivorans]|uniref:ArsA-related P-loop ATPase n=1 Tax=Granulicoccus phenolivorans TaxID=266854 RepID=UPI00047C20F8|nr:ArsA-related P-loop ATPase [Granulicoccus phenolivorans]
MTEADGPAHLLHVVTGKGGTGKTTVAAGLAWALATEGRRVLLCEVEQRHGISELLQIEPLTKSQERKLDRTAAGGHVFGLSINAEDALMEYLETFYHLGLAGRAMDRFGFVDFATSIAPGLKDILLTGKVYEAARRKLKGMRNAYDAVVLDAPPTGRIIPFLNVADAVSDLAKVGPIRRQADSITAVFKSRHTVVHVVTLLEDMPVTETLEAVADLRKTGFALGSVVCNRVTRTPFTDAELELAVKQELPLNVPGFTDEQTAGVKYELAGEANQIKDERLCRQQLVDHELPLVDIPEIAAGIDHTTINHVARVLAKALAQEVNP